MTQDVVCEEPAPACAQPRRAGAGELWQERFYFNFDKPRARHRPRAALAALRPHQWVKNLLVLLPLFLAHQVNPLARLWPVLAALAAFCCAASSVYLLNDVIDIEADRRHATKRRRPIASGELSPNFGLTLSAIAGAAGFALASTCVSMPFVGMLALYGALATVYSLFVKRQLLLDVILLAGLYTLRIAAGAVAARVPLSPWLAAFAMFFFFSLALGKRYIELRRTTGGGQPLPTGRGYRADDAHLLESLGPASGFLAVLVFYLYIDSDAVAALYHRAWLLWAVCPVLLYWVTRFWLLARRDEVHDDPVVFALKDRASLASIALTAALVWAASA
ncbi:MAG TPA: UbiA family prenyltransferase [Pirellulales bacterium]|nr:UbiA family prenyltransferase [Pirellulales bacterium]